jgi:Pyridoxamine 5'-phosphate oxidase
MSTPSGTRKRSQRAAPPRASRPHMPGYGVSRSRKGLLAWTWAERRLTGSRTYWLVTVRPDGRPHAMPIWGIWVEGAFYFSSGPKARKARNLARNPRCVVCTDPAHAAVILEGTAHVAPVAAQPASLAGRYHAKYRPWKLDPALGPVYRVRPRVAFGMDERRFPTAATRWRF